MTSQIFQLQIHEAGQAPAGTQALLDPRTQQRSG